MRTISVSALAFLCLGALSVAGYFLTASGVAAPPANRGLQIAPEALHFEDHWMGEEVTCTIPVRNSSSKELLVTDLFTGCSCVSIARTSFRIPAGGTENIRATITLPDTPSSTASDGDQELVPFSALLVPIFATGATNESGWQIEGRFQRVVSASPPRVDYGSILLGTTPGTKIVRIRTHVQVDRLEVVDGDGLRSIRITRSPDDSRTFLVYIAPGERSTPGEFNLKCRLRPFSSRHPSLPDFEIKVLGRVRAPVDLQPSAIVFSNYNGAELATHNVSLVSLLDRPFTVQNITCDGDDKLSVERIESEPDSQLFRVVLRPKSQVRRGAVMFRVKQDGISEAFELTLPLFYPANAPLNLDRNARASNQG